MVSFDRAFVAVGLAWLNMGMILGLYIGITSANQFIPVHVTMMLPGFAVLTLYGLIYRGWPELNESRLGHLQFWLATIAVLGQVFGALQFSLSGGIEVTLIAAASGLAIVAGLLLAVLFLTQTDGA